MKKVLCIIIIMIITFIVSSCQADKNGPGKGLNMDKVDSIYIYHYSFGICYKEFKIDLVEEKFYWFYVDDLWNPVERDENSENEGYEGISNLLSDKVNIFKKNLNKSDFLKWEDRYVDPDVYDGHQWSIRINFNDGNHKVISGSNDYPDTWEQVSKEFERLIGKRVF